MVYYIVLRGPAGSGKTTVARKLASRLSAYPLFFDRILATHKRDKIVGNGISTENFIKGNEIILPELRRRLENNQIVIIDACFYRKGHLEHLIKNLPYKHFVFSLQTSLDECIRRNRKRKGMTAQDIAAVFSLVSAYKAGIPIQTEGKTEDQVIEEILKRLK